jgi:NADH:ubiquinone oxidoreductase subunit E
MDKVSLIPGNKDEVLLLAGFSGKPDELIALLQHYQKTNGFISQEDVQQIAVFLKVSEAHIYGVASFYAQFRFTKPGENILRLCLGTACHVQGGEQLSTEIQTLLGICPGEITPDGRFELQQVACLGCCAQAPVVEINGRIFGKMTPDKLRKVLKKYEAL